MLQRWRLLRTTQESANMAIERFYTTTASSERDGFVGASTVKKSFSTHIASFPCHIQPLDATLAQALPGGIGKNWLMVCPVLDIKEGDKVIAENITYNVTAVETYKMGGNTHMEISIRTFRE